MKITTTTKKHKKKQKVKWLNNLTIRVRLVNILYQD